MKLLSQIYDAVDDDEVYDALPTLIDRELGSRSCTLQCHSPDGEVESLVNSHFPDDMNRYYVDHGFFHYDKWTEAFFRFDDPFGSAQRASDRLGIDEYRNSVFYNEFIRRFGDDSAYCLGCIQTRPDKGKVIVGVHRGIGQPDFDEGSKQAMNRLAPHLLQMAVLRQKLQAAQTDALVAQSGLEAISTAIFLVNGSGRIVFGNGTALAMIEAGDAIIVSAGRLGFRDHKAQANWLSAFDAALNRREGGSAAFLAGLSAVNPWRIQVAPRDVGGETVVMVMIERGTVQPGAERILRELFGLTANEAKVAVAIASGLDGSAIARALDVKVPTVRTHSAHIYSKMQINKASDLVRLVASLPPLSG